MGIGTATSPEKTPVPETGNYLTNYGFKRHTRIAREANCAERMRVLFAKLITYNTVLLLFRG